MMATEHARSMLLSITRKTRRSLTKRWRRWRVLTAPNWPPMQWSLQLQSRLWLIHRVLFRFNLPLFVIVLPTRQSGIGVVTVHTCWLSSSIQRRGRYVLAFYIDVTVVSLCSSFGSRQTAAAVAACWAWKNSKLTCHLAFVTAWWIVSHVLVVHLNMSPSSRSTVISPSCWVVRLLGFECITYCHYCAFAQFSTRVTADDEVVANDGENL